VPTDEHLIFRLVPRERRVEYVKAMHGTLVVKRRDVGRMVDALVRAVAKSLRLPA
jgi:hypothetical protein